MEKKNSTTGQKVSFIIAMLFAAASFILIILQVSDVLPDMGITKNFLICGMLSFNGLYQIKQSKIAIGNFICSGLYFLLGVMNLIDLFK